MVKWLIQLMDMKSVLIHQTFNLHQHLGRDTHMMNMLKIQSRKMKLLMLKHNISRKTLVNSMVWSITQLLVKFHSQMVPWLNQKLPLKTWFKQVITLWLMKLLNDQTQLKNKILNQQLVYQMHSNSWVPNTKLL